VAKSALLACLAGLTALPAAAGDPHCWERDGRCMAVTVNGQKPVKLDKKTKKMLAAMDSAFDHRDECRYELATPLRGKLEVLADRSSDAGPYFGEALRPEVMIVPLSDVALETHQEVGLAQGVQVSGSTPSTARNVLEGDRLPPGPYFLVISLWGKKNWDRMTLFVRVAE
jgi:hypothetical protein